MSSTKSRTSVERPRVPTIAKVAQILHLFTSTTPTWRLNQIANALDWDRATTHRILGSLVEEGILARTTDGEEYEAGPLPLQLAAVSLNSGSARRQLDDWLADIASQTGFTTQIGILLRASVAIVASSEASSPVKAAAMLGDCQPLHAMAVGKAILSQMSDAEINRLLPTKLEAFASRTITSRKELLRQVAQVREVGFAVADSELSEGLYAASIPLLGVFGSKRAAVTCAGPPPSMVPDAWASVVPTLERAVAELPAMPQAVLRSEGQT